jgi:uncharacterized damage-inducible protein DinB
MDNVKTYAFADTAGELAATRRVLERVPQVHIDWRPHAKSRPLGELAAHIADIAVWLTHVLNADQLDFGAAPPPPVSPERADEIVRAFDAAAEAFQPAFDALPADELTRDWTLRIGDRVFFTRPKAVVLRSFCFTHIAHHRGQLMVYLRLLDVPLPPVLGPTADEG